MKVSKKTTLEQLAVYVCEHLRSKGIDAILTGGAVVSIYTDGEYLSYDLDFVAYGNMKTLRKAMEELGFFVKDRYFKHRRSDFFIEFLNPPLAVGQKAITTWPVRETETGSLFILTPTQCVMDRLAAYYHWNDHESLKQALLVVQKQDVDLNEVRDWSAGENRLPEFNVFLKELEKLKIR